MGDASVTWIRSPTRHAGPDELIGVLEVRADGSARAAIAVDDALPVFPWRPA